MDMMKSNPQVMSPFPVLRGSDPTVAEPSEDLEFQGSFAATAVHCRKLGWRLAAVDARDLVDLAVDFTEPAEQWLGQCRRAGSLQGRVNLGVHTGSASGLVVLEVGNGEGKSVLDHGGSWRSSCQARMNGREQHYFTLPPGVAAPPTRFLMAARVMVFGEGGLAPLPPSVDVQTQESWRWQNPPWECPPPELPRSLQEFLKQLSSMDPAPKAEDEILSWDEVYRLITPHEELLKALLAPHQTLEEYYGDLLGRALKAGFKDRKLLLGLLWHAPQGDVAVNPGRGNQLRRMVQEAKLDAAVSPCMDGAQVTTGPGAKAGALGTGSQYEAILGELKRLVSKAAELEALLLDWNPNSTADLTPVTFFSGLAFQNPSPREAQYPDHPQRQAFQALAGDHLVKGEAKFAPAVKPAPINDPDDPWQSHYSQLAPVVQADPSVEVLEATIHDCLERNPDLAKDPAKLQMVQYCFKNYVNIDPDLSDLPFPERWERASQMAREFMGA